MNKKNNSIQNRESSFELLRIILMLLIIAHHYIVNSGVLLNITPINVLKTNSIFALIFGWAGKTCINCFVLLTGYFMCKSQITIKKILKLLLEIEFYNILIFLIFAITGYAEFSLGNIFKAIFPFYGLGYEFIPSYLVLFLLIPFINILIKNLKENQHILLIIICLIFNSLFQTFLEITDAFTYIGHFISLYLIASYLRMHPKQIFNKKKLWGILTLILIILSFGTIFNQMFMFYKFEGANFYRYVSDSNQLLAVLIALSAFLTFKNMKLKYSPLINTIASASFGVLLIHANSDFMRQWLWKDTLKNVAAFNNNYFVLHAILSVLGVYIICTVIDLIRIRLLEEKFFKWYDYKNIEVLIKDKFKSVILFLKIKFSKLFDYYNKRKV